MSFRFGADATGNARVTRTGGAPDPQGAGGWTVCGWFYLSADRNDFSSLIRLHASSGSTTRFNLATASDGTTPSVFTPGNTGGVAGVDAFTVGAWLFVAVTQSGTTATIYTCTSVGGTLHSASGTSSGGSAPDGYTIGGRASSDATEWFNGRARCVRQWATVLTSTELAAERDSLTAVKASRYSDHPLATGTDLSDVSGNSRTLTAGSVAGTTEADPPIGSSAADTLTGVRVGQLADTVTSTLVRADALGATRVAGAADSAAIGVSVPDPLAAARATSLADTAVIGVAVADLLRGARAGAPPDTPAVGIARPDTPGSARAVGLPEAVAGGLVLPDLLGGARAYSLPDSSVTTLQAPDFIGGVRVGGPAEQAQAGLVLLDVIGHTRIAALGDGVAAGLVLADHPSAARVGALLEAFTAPALTLPVQLGAVRVAALAVVASSGQPTERDIAVTAHVLPARHAARVLPARHAAEILPSRWIVTEV